MGARREIIVGGGGTLPIGGAGGEGADSRRAVQGDGLASQARGASAGEASSRRREAADGSASRPTTPSIKDALVALWEASDRICGKRLKVMIPTLLPALERHGRLKLGEARSRAGAGGQRSDDRPACWSTRRSRRRAARRRRVGFYSAIRREVPIRTFNDWNDPPPGFCEVDMVAHGGTSVAGSFIQTLTMVDVATGWTECLPSGDARERARRPGDETGTEPVPLAHARRRLRQ